VAKLLFDRYRIISQLGEGGAGAVLLAFDQRIARRVAIKRLPLADDARAAQASLQEARIAALLQHPHIVQILDFEIAGNTGNASTTGTTSTAGSTSDTRNASAPQGTNQPAAPPAPANSAAYLIMEYLDGITLADIPSEDLDADIIAAVIEAIGGALSFAHDNGVLHLDVKPNNILIDHNGQIKLADFGLSLLTDRSGLRHAEGGTLGYMPLEQLQGRPVSAACDQWALAAVLYELCTDEYPYFNEVARHPTLARLRAAQEAGEAPLLQMQASGLTEVFARALARDPQQRYDSVAEFCAEVAPYFGDTQQGASALRELCGELTDSAEESEDRNPDETDRLAHEDARALRAARLQRRARNQAVRPARGALGWLVLLLSLLAVCAAATALACVLTPALITQLFGDKRLAIGVGSVSFFILVSMIMLLLRAALRRRD